jgi:hypothetical protein
MPRACPHFANNAHHPSIASRASPHNAKRNLAEPLHQKVCQGRVIKNQRIQLIP